MGTRARESRATRLPDRARDFLRLSAIFLNPSISGSFAVRGRLAEILLPRRAQRNKAHYAHGYSHELEQAWSLTPAPNDVLEMELRSEWEPESEDRRTAT